MDAEHIVTLCKLKDSIEAEILRLKLESEGISCQLGGEHQAGMTGVFEIDLLVKEEDLPRAKEIADKFRAS